LYRGRIVTVDIRFRLAEAVAVRNDRCIKVGTNEEVREALGKNTGMIDPDGKTVSPGFIDGHAYMEGTGFEREI